MVDPVARPRYRSFGEAAACESLKAFPVNSGAATVWVGLVPSVEGSREKTGLLRGRGNSASRLSLGSRRTSAPPWADATLRCGFQTCQPPHPRNRFLRITLPASPGHMRPAGSGFSGER